MFSIILTSELFLLMFSVHYTDIKKVFTLTFLSCFPRHNLNFFNMQFEYNMHKVINEVSKTLKIT